MNVHVPKWQRAALEVDPDAMTTEQAVMLFCFAGVMWTRESVERNLVHLSHLQTGRWWKATDALRESLAGVNFHFKK